MNEKYAADVSAISKIDAVPNILEVICRTTGLGFSAVARVTDTHWVACAVRDEIAFGLETGGELVLETTICNEIRDTGEIVVIDHVSEDDKFCNHPTPLQYGFQSYISVPIKLPDGEFFGTLCAIDPRPARVNTVETIGMFQLFADLIGMHLDTQERMQASEAALITEREAAKLRDQFIAVLGHDLRNPVGAIKSGVEVLRTMPQSPESTMMLDIIQRSTTRMTGLINNVLDFARGRLGGGLPLTRKADEKLEDALRQVVSELQTAWADRQIDQQFHIDRPVVCDSARLGQMLSNLIANALTHGDPSSPVLVSASSTSSQFEMSVINQGPEIPPQVKANLFEPFARGNAGPGKEGLGLGLYIATEIARAHQGTLEVESANGDTCFLFRMPVQHE